jgi:hypothetical protein
MEYSRARYVVNRHGASFVVAAMMFASCAASTPAHLDDVTPSVVAPGGLVTVTGERMCGVPADCDHAAGEFQLDSDSPVRAQVMTYGDTEAQLLIPAVTPLGMVTLVLVVNDTASNGLAMEIVEP